MYYLIALGNCAFVTRNVDIFFSCSNSISLFISGYIIGSPTNDSAQCCTDIPSKYLSYLTPGTPVIKFIIYNKILFIEKGVWQEKLLYNYTHCNFGIHYFKEMSTMT